MLLGINKFRLPFLINSNIKIIPCNNAYHYFIFFSFYNSIKWIILFLNGCSVDWISKNGGKAIPKKVFDRIYYDIFNIFLLSVRTFSDLHSTVIVVFSLSIIITIRSLI